MSKDIKINMIGQIIKGDDLGRYIKIVDDIKNTGGYLILTSNEINFNDGYDDWVFDKKCLVKYFEESNWDIKWILTS
jgi:hypothetical protein